jgi:hypothetical protein
MKGTINMKTFNHIHSIIPPHILDALANNPNVPPEVQEAARKTIALAEIDDFRNQRIAASATLLNTTQIIVTAGPAHKNRRVYNANHGTSLPGTLARSEGQAATADQSVNECYDGFGATFDLYYNIFGRNSIDNAGMDLVGTVHYDQSYNNAYWNGSQMVFGDGDGIIFNRFTAAIDVVGHELAHGVTQHTANLDYSRQSGALNESMSDVFGSMVKQYKLNQKAADADWLIGGGIFTNQVHGVALRSMKAPGTAYDDPKLGGKDPQPAHMSNYVNTSNDHGGVHINSGIPNHAFYLLAVALGGYSWEKAGRIWYATLCDSRLTHSANFVDFASLTADNAAKLFDAATQNAVIDAWGQVGIVLGIPHVILFEHANFHGAHKHVLSAEANLAASDDNFFNDRVSSIVVPTGEWTFFKDINFANQYPPKLGSGLYPWVEAVGIKNDDMSSLRPTSVSGSAMLPHVILFEHANFHGAHKHVFGWESNLAAGDDNFFNDRVSSIIVIAGTWAFFKDVGYANQYSRILGPGAYPWVEAVGIKNDDMSSLHPTSTSGRATLPHVILFEHANFHGAHKHVLGAEANLAAGDDNFLNDRVSSIIVLSGNWVFFKDINYVNRYPRTLGPGLYSWVEAVSIKNDDMSSLRPL